MLNFDRFTVKHGSLLRIFRMLAATSGFLAASEFIEFVLGRGSAPDTTGELTALPRPPSWFKGPYFSKGLGKGGRGERREEGERKEREGPAPPSANS